MTFNIASNHTHSLATRIGCVARDLAVPGSPSVRATAV